MRDVKLATKHFENTSQSEPILAKGWWGVEPRGWIRAQGHRPCDVTNTLIAHAGIMRMDIQGPPGDQLRLRMTHHRGRPADYVTSDPS